MIEWIVRHFVPNADDVSSPQVRERYGLVASIVCICCNVVLSLGKGVVGFLAGSVSIVADAANNLSDALSNVVSLLGFKLASRPPDEGHPYGHGRYEYLSSLAVAIIVIVMGLDLMRDGAARIISPAAPAYDLVSMGVLVASMLVKLWMMHLNNTLGTRIKSEALHATALDSRNDVVATGAVLVSAILTKTCGVVLDGWLGLAVGGFIMWSGAMLVLSMVDALLGRAPDPELVERVRARVLCAPGVLGMHDLMVHDYGPGRQFASAHVEMAPTGDVLEDHEVLDAIERDLWEHERLIITLHLDPLERKPE